MSRAQSGKPAGSGPACAADALHFPSHLDGFSNTETAEAEAASGRTVIRFRGVLEGRDDDRVCPECGGRMHVNNHNPVSFRHLCIGSSLTTVEFERTQYQCPRCGATRMQDVPFKADGHLITRALHQYAVDLLATETYTNKQVAEITGLGRNVVKAIDMQRLMDRYTLDGKLIRPERTASFLGIDEFKLHDGWRFATHIIDMETGHILWIAEGKSKQAVYDFIDHVGQEWMSHVVAVVSDMNSDFQDAFRERCPHIVPVYDHFHIVKNFNDTVISAIRKDEQKRLEDAGDRAAARSLKRARHILTSSRPTLERKDAEAARGPVIRRGSTVFGTRDVVRSGGNVARYEALLAENELLFTADLIREKLSDAYRMTDEARMAAAMDEIIGMCRAAGNSHLSRFASMLESHMDGIVTHARYAISTGRIEGINQRIKTLRRQGYGYPDDEYFFLKLIDASRQNYIRNPKSHKIND